MISPISLAGIVLLLSLLLAMPMATAQPPTLTRPQVVKIAIPEPDSLTLGDTVSFVIIVENPANPTPPEVVVDWYQVEATDVVSSALEIDTDNSGITAFQGEEPVMQIADNTVVVAVDLLRPGDYCIFQIVCTVVGPLETGMVIVNQAIVDYEDSEGSEEETIYSDPLEIPVDYYPLFLPFVAKH
jgi:hypothetical protein